MAEQMHPQVATMPRVKLLCGVDYLRDGFHGRHFEVGALWDANPWPRSGELIYRKWWVIRFHLDRR